jgi:hypothetical protein
MYIERSNTITSQQTKRISIDLGFLRFTSIVSYACGKNGARYRNNLLTRLEKKS